MSDGVSGVGTRGRIIVRRDQPGDLGQAIVKLRWRRRGRRLGPMQEASQGGEQFHGHSPALFKTKSSLRKSFQLEEN
jgi:hypothetical protein